MPNIQKDFGIKVSGAELLDKMRQDLGYEFPGGCTEAEKRAIRYVNKCFKALKTEKLVETSIKNWTKEAHKFPSARWSPYLSTGCLSPKYALNLVMEHHKLTNDCKANKNSENERIMLKGLFWRETAFYMEKLYPE